MVTGKLYNINADVVRVLAGFGVVFIHVSDPFLVYPPYLALRGVSFEIIFLINTFCKISVPLFIMLSGYLLLKPSPSFNVPEFYRKRLSRIIIPLIFWIGVFFAWFAYVGHEVTISFIIERIVTVNLEFLYFIFVILELYYVTPLLVAFMTATGKRMHAGLLVSSLVFTMMVTAVNYLFPEKYLNLQSNMVTVFLPYLCFYILGFYLREYKIRWKYSLYTSLLVFLVTGIIWFFSDGSIDSYWRHYGGPPMSFLVIAAFTLVLQSEWIDRLKKNARAKTIVATAASGIFGVYLIHMLVINIMGQKLLWVPETTAQPLWLFVLFKTILVFLSSLAIVLSSRRIPFVRRVFGF